MNKNFLVGFLLFICIALLGLLVIKDMTISKLQEGKKACMEIVEILEQIGEIEEEINL